MAKILNKKNSLNFENLSPIKNFIGREFELDRLKKIFNSDNSSIVILHGRRRVGKTETLEKALYGFNVLKFEGLEDQSVSKQRQAFLDKLASYAGDINIAKLQYKTWREVFIKLAEHLEEDTVVYLEELQWLANYRKDLVSDLKFVWDNYFRKIKGFKLVLCGSASSFMLKKVIKSKALYSRSIHEIPLSPFSIREAKEYLSSYSNLNVLESYLLFGGIPEYLKYLKEYETPQVALRREAFVPGGYFLSEFERVFISSLSKYEIHKQVVKAFAKRNFYERYELAKKVGISAGGSFSVVLEDLELIGLVDKLKSHSHGKYLYYLKDPYLNSYLKLIEEKLSKIKQGQYKNEKISAIDSREYSQYLGYAFERFCRENHHILAKILQISGIEYDHGPYEIRNNGMGFQFDLLFKRKDRCYTCFEIKFQSRDLSKQVIKDFENKLLNLELPSSYNIQKVLISAGPVSKSLKDSLYFDRIIELDEIIEAF